MQEANPELVEELRNQMRQGGPEGMKKWKFPDNTNAISNITVMMTIFIFLKTYYLQ